MESKEIRITIDPQGNIRREIIEHQKPEPRKPRFLKKLASALSF